MIQKSSDILLIILFLLAIFIPPVTTMVTQDAKWSETEKRLLTPAPQLPKTLDEIVNFTYNFENYYNDHFGFREFLIYRYHREMKKRFGLSGTPRALQGKGKWLFYTGDNLLEDFQGNRKLTIAELEKWYSTQHQRYLWLKDKGIHYVSFSPPNKQSIYPEFLPDDFLQIKGETQLEQLHKYLISRPLQSYINIKETILKNKNTRKMYFEHDTHWNHYGAYVGFKKVMEYIQKLYPQESFVTDFTFYKKPQRSYGGDLALMLLLNKKSYEVGPKLNIRKFISRHKDFTIPLSNLGAKKYQKPQLTTSSRSSLRAIIFADSFITYIFPFFSENFGQVLYLRKPYDQKNIEELLTTFRPHIVIEERVERNLFKKRTLPTGVIQDNK